MLTKEIVKEYANRKCDKLAYNQLENKRLLSFWKELVESKKNPEDFIDDGSEADYKDKDYEPKQGISAFEYFRTNPEALKEALKIYKEVLSSDGNEASQFIVDNEDFQEVSVLSRRYFALQYQNCKRADTVDGTIDGVEIENQGEIEANTQKYLKDPSVDVIFEGQITIDGLRARFDVLVRDGDSFKLYEVKGSGTVTTGKLEASLKTDYLYDMGFQYYVYKKAGLPLSSLGFVHLNKLFHLTEEAYPPEDNDVLNLFVIRDYLNVTERHGRSYEIIGTISLKDYYDTKQYINLEYGKDDVEVYINRLLRIQTFKKEPEAKCHYQCRKGEFCPLINACFNDVDYRHILKLTCNGSGGGNHKTSAKYINQGITKIKDIPTANLDDDYAATKISKKGINKRNMARLQIEYAKELECRSKAHHLETKVLKELLGQDYSVFPLIFFDFESFNYPVPLVNECHPWQQICCQYSMHVVQKDYDLSKHDFAKGVGGGITHYEFLGDPRKDGFKNPEIDLILTLKKQLEDAGVDLASKHYRVVVYNQSFEKSRLSEMAEQFPDYADFLNAFNDCVVDLYNFFVWGYWYHKDFNGSVSLKTTQPTLIKDSAIQNWYNNLPYDLKGTLNYKAGIIQNGGVALDTYKTMLRTTHSHKVDDDLFDKLRESLLHYCKIDSWGTVILYDIIYKAIQKLEDGTLDIDAEVHDDLLSSIHKEA